MRHQQSSVPTGNFERPSQVARKLAKLLLERGERIAFAESCTCGLAAATMGAIPGISQVFCGSMVVYRSESKRQWLGLSTTLLASPEQGPVSQECSQALATSLLQQTPEANLVATITGHLGPDNTDRDGLLFVSLLHRRQPDQGEHRRHRLRSPSPLSQDDFDGRSRRLEEATLLFFTSIFDWYTNHQS